MMNLEFNKWTALSTPNHRRKNVAQFPPPLIWIFIAQKAMQFTRDGKALLYLKLFAKKVISNDLKSQFLYFHFSGQITEEDWNKWKYVQRITIVND